MYKSEKTIKEFYDRAVKVAKNFTNDYEIIIVDDGSPDSSIEIAKQIQEQDKRVKIIEFTRNFGHHNALMAGTLAAQKDLVFIIDSDLEEAPEDFLILNKSMITEKVDIVLSQQKSRKGGFTESTIGGVFYKIFDVFSEKSINIPKDVLTSRLITSEVVNTLKKYQEYSLFYGGIMSDTGYNYCVVKLNKGFKGETTYTFSKRIKLLFESFSDFSFAPLKLIIFVGLIVFFLAFTFLVFVLVEKLFLSTGSFDGYVSIMLMLLFILSFQLLSTGIVGYYIWKILLETKKRPRWVIRKED